MLVGLTHVESTPLPLSLESARTKRKEGAAAMKNQAIHYLGLDVHQATTVVSVRNEHGANSRSKCNTRSREQERSGTLTNLPPRRDRQCIITRSLPPRDI